MKNSSKTLLIISIYSAIVLLYQHFLEFQTSIQAIVFLSLCQMQPGFPSSFPTSCFNA